MRVLLIYKVRMKSTQNENKISEASSEKVSSEALWSYHAAADQQSGGKITKEEDVITPEKQSENVSPETDPTGFLNQEVSYVDVEKKEYRTLGRHYLYAVLDGQVSGLKSYAELCEKMSAEKVFGEKFSTVLTEDELRVSKETLRELETTRMKMIEHLLSNGAAEQDIKILQTLSDAKAREETDRGFSDILHIQQGNKQKALEEYVRDPRELKVFHSSRGKKLLIVGVGILALGGWGMTTAFSSTYPVFAFLSVCCIVVGFGCVGYGLYRIQMSQRARHQSLAQFSLDMKKGIYKNHV